MEITAHLQSTEDEFMNPHKPCESFLSWVVLTLLHRWGSGDTDSLGKSKHTSPGERGSWIPLPLPLPKPTQPSEQSSHRPRGGVPLVRTESPWVLPRRNTSVVTVCPLPPLTSCSTSQDIQDWTASTNTMSISKMGTKKGTSAGQLLPTGPTQGVLGWPVAISKTFPMAWARLLTHRILPQPGREGQWWPPSCMGSNGAQMSSVTSDRLVLAHGIDFKCSLKCTHRSIKVYQQTQMPTSLPVHTPFSTSNDEQSWEML